MCLQARVYHAVEAPDDCLVLRRILACRDSFANEPTHVHQYPCILLCLARIWFLYRPPDSCEEFILYCWGGWGLERKLRAPPKVHGVLPQGGTVEAPQSNLMI